MFLWRRSLEQLLSFVFKHFISPEMYLWSIFQQVLSIFLFIKNSRRRTFSFDEVLSEYNYFTNMYSSLDNGDKIGDKNNNPKVINILSCYIRDQITSSFSVLYICHKLIGRPADLSRVAHDII